MGAWRRVVIAMALVAVASTNAGFANATLGRADIRQAERWLADLGFWTGPIDGIWDDASRQALIAFQKIQHARPTGRLTRAEWNALSMATPPRPRDTGAPHVEVDLARQVLFLVDDAGKVSHILPISSGTGKTFHEKGYPETRAITPCGRLQVYAEEAGWRKSPLGAMYNPLYIVGGIAIHGSEEMRNYPASHGCIRIPMFAARVLPRLVAKGTPVFVYGCAGEGGEVAQVDMPRAQP